MKLFDRRPNEPALDAVLEEARRVPAPELDWDRIQQRMWRSIDRQPEPEKRGFALRALWVVPALGLAAGAALWFGHNGVEPTSPIATVSQQVSALDGDSLERDELLQAGPSGLRVTHPGRAEWTLEPNATASVQEHGSVVRVRLVSGALRARVVPTPEKERFVVEAAGTRVAVHGTVFRVAMEDGRNLVDVEEGVVAVAPLGSARAESVLLRAPMHAEFALSGVPLQSKHALAEKRGADASRAFKKPRVAARTLSSGNAPAPEVAEAQPDEASAAPIANNVVRQRLTIGEVEEGVAPVVAAITRCFSEGSQASGNLRVTAQSAVTLKVAPDGTLGGLSFNPPLSPSVQSCSERETSEVRFAPSVEGASVTRVLELTR